MSIMDILNADLLYPIKVLWSLLNHEWLHSNLAYCIYFTVFSFLLQYYFPDELPIDKEVTKGQK